ncbi:MAG: hypothetical protein HY742_06620 [Deltaproteobacteria bacterium]|nr:hypothetical protein [Deltaproteobacteria bacterium]
MHRGCLRHVYRRRRRNGKRQIARTDIIVNGGRKGERISWDEALDVISRNFLAAKERIKAARKHGAKIITIDPRR